MLKTIRKDYVLSKLICTLGPSSCSAEKISELSKVGMDVGRINLSHGGNKEHIRLIKLIRENSDAAILFDISGPKIRIGSIENPFLLKRKDEILLTTEDIIGDKNRISINYKNLPKELSVGNKIFINDGTIELKVIRINSEGILSKVIVGGELSSNKGVNIPNVKLNIGLPTEKDKSDIKLGIKHEVDWFAISFIRDKNDLKRTKNFIQENGGDIPIISKIEHGYAIKNFLEIL
ncbi:MAG: pyruvate kinase, partial [Candidatus Ranarchaeia archaeon]